MNDPIDKLKIEIDASADKATGKVDGLIGKLSELQRALSGTYNNPIKNFGDGPDDSTPDKLTRLATALKAFKDVNISKSTTDSIERLKVALKSFTVGDNVADKLTSVSNALATFKDGQQAKINNKLGAQLIQLATGIDAIKQGDAEKLSTIGEALQAISGGGKANVSISGLASFGKFLETIDGKEGKVADLTSSLERIGKIDFSNIPPAAAGIQQIVNSSIALSNAVNQIQQQQTESAAESERASESAANASNTLSQALDKIKKSLNSATGDTRKFMDSNTSLWNTLGSGSWVLGKVKDGIAAIAAKYPLAQIALKALTFAFNTVQQAADKAYSVLKKIASFTFEGLKASLSALTSVTQSIFSAFGKLGMNTLQLSKTLAAVPFKAVANKFTDLAKAAVNLVNSFKRIIMYRGIRTIIKEIGDAFKTGINNLYQWSKALNDTFSVSMDAAATALQYFKNSIGAAVSPLIMQLVPVLDAVIDRVVNMINIINELFSALGGSGVYTRAVKATAEYAEATGNAAEKIKPFLASFDEINRIEDSNSRKAGAASIDFTNMFEKAEIDKEIRDFTAKIKAALDDDSWDSLGKLVGDKINSIVDGINAVEYGQKFGELLNDVFSTEYFTLNEIDFENIGAKIGEFINNALAKIDGDTAGRLAVKKITVLLDIGIGLVEELSPETVGKFVGDFFEGAISETQRWLSEKPWEEIGTKIGNLAQAALVSLYDTLENHTFGELGKSIALLINGVLESDFDFELLGRTFTRIFTIVFDNLAALIINLDTKKVGKAIGDFINGAVEEFKEWITENSVEIRSMAVKIIEGIREAIMTITPGDIAEAINQTVLTAIDVAGTLLSDPVTWSLLAVKLSSAINDVKWEEILSSAGKVIGSAFNALILAVSVFVSNTDFNKIAEAIGTGINKLFMTVNWNRMFSTLSKSAIKIVEALGTIIGTIEWDTILTDIANALGEIKWEDIGTAIGNLISTINEKNIFDKLADIFIKLADGILAGIGKAMENGKVTDLIGKITDALIKVMNGINMETVVGVLFELFKVKSKLQFAKIELFAELGINIIDGISLGIKRKLLEGFMWLKDLFVDLIKRAFDSHSPAKTMIPIGENITAGIFEGITAAWDWFLESLGGIVQGLIDFFTGKWEDIKQGASDAWGEISGFFSETWSGIVEGASGIWDGLTTTIGGIWTSVTEEAGTAWSDISGFLSTTWESISGSASELFGGVATFVKDGWDAISKKGDEVWGHVHDFATGTWEKVQKSAETNWGLVQENVATNISDAFTSFTKTAGDLYDDAKEKFEDIKGKAKTEWEDTKKNIVDNISDAYKDFKPKVEELWKDAKGKFEAIAKNAKTNWSSIKDSVVLKFQTAKDKVIGFSKNIYEDVLGKWETIKTEAESKWSTIKGTVETKWGALKTSLSEVKWEDIGENLVYGLRDGVSGVWNNVTTTVSNFAKDLTGTVKGIFGVNSPSTVWTTIGEFLGQGLNNGISNKTTEVTRTAEDMAKGVNDTWGELQKNAKTAWGDGNLSYGSIGDIIIDGFKNIRKGLETEWTGLSDWWSRLSLPEFHIRLPHFSMSGTFDPENEEVPTVSVDWYAKGGFPRSASLFWANENGVPEYVGRMGNNAAVAAPEQIVQGVSRGVENANEDLISVVAAGFMQVVNAINDNSGNAIDVRALATAIARAQNNRVRALGVV